ncbi:MAG: hypothetical protein OEW99_07495, partial [Gammaproteobacteria bacterium]|nr:hypothetical protein [Gammaproteobacteria bacterium]
MKLKFKEKFIFLIFSVIALSLAISSCGSRPKYQSVTTSASKQSVIKTAKSMLGVNYRYGGTSPNKGFDCS